ncbi:ricin-type beta-trefoil lectin domain protein [Streptomyces sp. NBC_00102]|uniref:ricin-type beta-trefoil lectin domain protein n=1 Tax=Streptomyces sp. NBC_00102 TaxID=2975652 RepID=UPI0022581FE8|nr:ricin-type beta-trefoil lectin domain protein [Streptomyces sp. NBC_00102]MCX5398113.1 ricin-type beta-trefoil lectin domain protein [Streptomyces sp. NBC_00102]
MRLKSARPQRGWTKALRLLSVAAVTVAAVSVGGTMNAEASVPAPPSGFTLTWSDDFNGASGTGIDQSLWKYDTGPGSNFGTGEIETMTNSTSNVYYDGQSHLVLQALHSGSDPRAGWTSGRVETQAATFGAPAGGVVRMESVLQQPNVTTANGAGYWPAFWMLGAPLRSGVTWPKSGEIDIMEDINGRSSVFGAVHCGVSPGGPCNEGTGITSGERACSGCQTGFHDYAVEIDRSVSPEQVRFYLDGNNYYTIYANQVDATTWADAIDHPFYIIYDLAIGGGFPDAFGGGPNAATVSGGKLIIDSVAVYNKAPGSTGGGSTGGSVTGQTIVGPGGKCVDVAGDDNGGDGTAVQLWDCQSTAKDQHWTWSGQSLQTLGKCLDIAGGNSAAGTQLQLATCNTGGYQSWVKQSDGTLKNPTSGRCIDSPNGATANGTRLQIWDCNTSAAQKFSIGSSIKGPGGKCVDVAGDDNGGDGTAVQLWDCQSTAKDQQWTWSGQTLQTLGKCLDIAGGNSAAGTKLQLATCNGGGYQNWVANSNGSMSNPTSGRCIDSPDGATANGTRLQIWDCNSSAAQKFALG